ncbi:protein-L-isoaspartate(D-aspartate) O-methyltransferase [Collimonas sp. OK307]|uniref:protein-L-isoaspartate O-methyltransferase family protein n=1 Tax=Collimonas sp. OK307 TaxID=1801620 RepID=UPI0008E51151|nr:protein-L-isoaspartate O-methyltransferase [Collimonas sp. OK307]SFH99745.1 protein-L-isoaspartate(D-aspartate) O-methyltransferase [Collimonas sp. OK307]
MNIEQARFNMIEQQIRPWNVLDLDVLELLTVVRREEFVPAAYKSLAFSDTEIPLPGGESMLAPKVEARLLQEAAVKKHEQVLEIGSGSGYMAALLCYKARHVTTVEIDPELKTLAAKNLAAYGITNVEVALGSGAQGWDQSETKTYDVIVISGSLSTLPDAFLKQLNVGGRIVAILGDAPVMTAQIITRTSDNSYSTRQLFETDVKPLRDAAVHSNFKF